LENGETKWTKSKDLQINSFIATPRKLIGGENDKLYLVDLIESNPVVHNLKDFVKQITLVLQKKYGTLRKAAKSLGLNENLLYHNWVKENARGNIKLNELKKIAEKAGLEWRDEVKRVSLYNGKIHALPVLIDKDILYIAGLLAGDGDIRKIA